mmetsp:Transcript_17235/g.50024  ORF Transcript_17235/g.50024 Transcript_17235/m.50024 type:complete len:242 (+) Transcript_17235:1276-2001(+)
MIIRIRNPNCGGKVIGRANANTLAPRPRPEVVLEGVVDLPSIFQDVAMAVGVEGDVVLHQDAMGAMEDDATLLALSDDILAHDASRDIFGHVEVYGIPTQQPLLAKVAYLDTLDVLVNIWRVEDNKMTSVESIVGVIRRSIALRLKNYGTAEPRHLGRHVGVVIEAEWVANGIRLREADLRDGRIKGLYRDDRIHRLDRGNDLVHPATRRFGVGNKDLVIGTGAPAICHLGIRNSDFVWLR